MPDNTLNSLVMPECIARRNFKCDCSVSYATNCKVRHYKNICYNIQKEVSAICFIIIISLTAFLQFFVLAIKDFNSSLFANRGVTNER